MQRFNVVFSPQIDSFEQFSTVKQPTGLTTYSSTFFTTYSSTFFTTYSTFFTTYSSTFFTTYSTFFTSYSSTFFTSYASTFTTYSSTFTTYSSTFFTTYSTFFTTYSSTFFTSYASTFTTYPSTFFTTYSTFFTTYSSTFFTSYPSTFFTTYSSTFFTTYSSNFFTSYPSTFFTTYSSTFFTTYSSTFFTSYHLPSSPATHLTSPPTHLPSSPPTHLPSSPPTHLRSSPATHLTSPPTHLPSSPPTHLPSSPPTHLLSSPPTHLPSSPPTLYLLHHLLIYLLHHLLIYFLTTYSSTFFTTYSSTFFTTCSFIFTGYSPSTPSFISCHVVNRPAVPRLQSYAWLGDVWDISSLAMPVSHFVLLVGASHLRSIVDGIVKMPEGRFSFGAMSTPGACATQLRTEAANAVLPRTPDAVCVMAPSNNLTSSRTITEAGEDFAKLLATACSRWPNVFAMDFPPRLTVDPDYQDMMRQEFRRVAARVKYTPIAEYFPSKELDLWSRDGVHLSDSAGMPILVGSIWNATYMQLVPAEPKPSPVVHRRSPPARRVTPRVIVKGEVAKSPQLDPSKWTVFGQGRKRSQHDEPEQSIDALKQAGTVQQEELEESYLPLTPVWFSSAMLVEMDKISPSHLPGPDECTPPVPKRQKKAKQRAPASKRTLAKRQGEAAPMVVEVIYGHLP
ncbi:hypothetical protein F7725_021282 [Dissostichus mawsoni]|uniref:Uncharacterized protein n=1 Tax=Dissostichus mawsoni TaxID=36200 RepID=A0A7J5YFN1_DISMA|nr:hypothetical protein F7725_021282 [Dissostichus mawsoni]